MVKQESYMLIKVRFVLSMQVQRMHKSIARIRTRSKGWSMLELSRQGKFVEERQYNWIWFSKQR